MGFNQAWAADAGALIVFAAAASLDGKPLPWAAYDTGQAAAHFTVQAHASGLYTHQMGGFDRDQIARAFDFGDDLAAVTVMAVVGAVTGIPTLMFASSVLAAITMGVGIYAGINLLQAR